MSTPTKPLRYLVLIDGQPPVGYNCALGVTNARAWSSYTARLHQGRVLVEHSNGDADVWKDYSPNRRTDRL